MERQPKTEKDEHRATETTERRIPQNGTEGNVSEGESSSGVFAAPMKVFCDSISSVKQKLISQMSDLSNSIQGSTDALTASVSSIQGRIVTAEQRISDVEDALRVRVT